MDKEGVEQRAAVPDQEQLLPDDAVIVIWEDSLQGSGFSWRSLLHHMGPGFLMCIAFVDPGNLEANLQTGAHTGYSLLWLLLWATAMGFLLQSLAARLGVATGRHLAQHCRDRYPGPVRIVLWLMAELAIIGSDIQEVIGTAIALLLLTNGALPLWGGVIVAAVAAYVILLLERFGLRWLEALFQVLVAFMAVTMGALFFFADVPFGQVARGLLVPRLDPGALPLAAALLGSIVMPHNLFLHSALLHNRELPHSSRSVGPRQSLFYYNLEAAAAVFVTLVINTAVISVFARGFYGHKVADKIGLENAGQYLGSRFGQKMQLIWAVGLLAAGQSSTMTGTYAGQFVMEGYLRIRMKPAARALITRAVAVGPTLLVALSARSDSTHLDTLSQWLNVLQSVQLPFAVVPLLALTSDRGVMGIGFANSRMTTVLAWVVAGCIVAVNAGMAYQTAIAQLTAYPYLHLAFWGGVAVYGTFVVFLVIASVRPDLLSTTLARRGDDEPVLLTRPLLGPAGSAENGTENQDSPVPQLNYVNRPTSPPMDLNSARSVLSSHAVDEFEPASS